MADSCRLVLSTDTMITILKCAKQCRTAWSLNQSRKIVLIVIDARGSSNHCTATLWVLPTKFSHFLSLRWNHFDLVPAWQITVTSNYVITLEKNASGVLKNFTRCALSLCTFIKFTSLHLPVTLATIMDGTEADRRTTFLLNGVSKHIFVLSVKGGNKIAALTQTLMIT